MTSLWLDRPLEQVGDPFPEDGSFDELVVGAGLTGLTTALLLARAGRRVGVVEARHVGAVTTGRTTAKVSLLQGTKLSQDPLPAYGAGGAVPTSRPTARARRGCSASAATTASRCSPARPSSTQPSPSELSAVRKEHDAAARLGLDVEWRDRLDVPFPNHGAMVLADQVQFDPMALLEALVAAAQGARRHAARGAPGACRSRRAGVPSSGSTADARCTPTTSCSPPASRSSTGRPTFAKVEPKRSYLLAYDRPCGARRDVPLRRLVLAFPARRPRSVTAAASSSSAAAATRSAARAPSGSTSTCCAAWTQEHFPGAVETHAWSAQDYSPYDGLPLVGSCRLGGGRIYYAHRLRQVGDDQRGRGRRCS